MGDNGCPYEFFRTSSPCLANDKIRLGVIGIGPRCKYDLQSILKFEDVECIAVADVQASRREDGKKFIAEQTGKSDCKFYADFREILVEAT